MSRARAGAGGPRLPPPVASVLGRLPPLPGAWLFCRVLSTVLGARLPADVRSALEGRSLRLRVLDAALQFDFTWQANRFTPRAGSGAPDLTIGATLHDLVLLARRQEDPDTLFFARRLVLEGDTELGLMVKNALDAIELPAPFWSMDRARR
jgi:predicted lipid carrier protein YhbT